MLETILNVSLVTAIAVVTTLAITLLGIAIGKIKV